MRRTFRYLRIAVTALSLVACVLLIALWVRSYTYRINIQTPVFANRTFQFSLLPGRMHFRTHLPEPDWISGFWQKHKSDPGFESWDYPNSPTFHLSINEYGPSDIAVHFPYWFSALISMALAAAPWLPWSRRFRLRTLLIATTLVAVALGIIALSR